MTAVIRINKWFNCRIEASTTVENAILIPLFTVISISLIALSFFIHDTIIIKSAAWESAIDVSSVTKKDISGYDIIYRQNVLNDKLKGETLFIRNPSVNIFADGGRVDVSTNSIFKMNFSFWNDKTINTVTSAKRVFPAMELRKIKAIKNTFKTIFN